MGALRLYACYATASIKGQMQYPASFVLLTIGQFLSTIVEFIGISALFSRFQSLGNWTLAQVALFYGSVNISFALADMISRGFDVFGPMFVKTGEFDRVLLRPRATALQLLGYELRLTRLGRSRASCRSTGRNMFSSWLVRMGLRRCTQPWAGS